MKDLMYIYDKTSPYSKHELGEIQTNFNQNFVIDGTKDSAKVIVFNFEEREVQPYSILRHQATDTWWIVSHDKVERVVNRLDSDEIEYWYKHNLELQGAIELLNARDLTDCGFNSNRYTVEQVFKRLVNLSNFEFTFALNPNNRNVIDYDKIVDYVKTFENYTLLSALREFFDAYNCSIKLHFIESNNTIIGAIFDLISKTGNTTRETLDESAFNQIQEVKTIDKDSFGTSVISNAQNVISTKSKTYPSSGLLKFSGNEYEIRGYRGNSPATAILRLPSDIYKVNWLEMVKKVQISIWDSNSSTTYAITYYPFNDKSMQEAYDYIKNKLPAGLRSDFENNFPIDRLNNYGARTFYYTDRYDAINDKFYSEYPIVERKPWTMAKRQTVISNKDLKDNVAHMDDIIYFERGKNIISGFDFFPGGTSASDHTNEAQFLTTNEGEVYGGTLEGYMYKVAIGTGLFDNVGNFEVNEYQIFNLREVGFVVNYIPMGDIKIKLDNSGTSKDSKIYNQNGKLTDSVALSKSLLSYSKEIESDNITKYARYYVGYTKTEIETIRIDNTPQVGDLVALNNDTYVINNVSKTFYPNESPNLGTTIEYYVDCEFTLSKQIAVKSLMVNPNQNIRDYGIPQNFNVKRKQLYRDFYELTHTQESSLSSGRLPLDRVLNVKNYYEPYQEHIGVMKLTFNGAYGGEDLQDTWYYQLESTTFTLKKSIYEIIDFKDNNIIGYSNQSVYAGFDITRLLTETYDFTNTPISYVDTNGEVKGIEIYFSTNDQLTSVYKSYMDGTGLDFSNSSYGAFYSCFIPSNIYTGVSDNSKHDFKVEELNYGKDATEVPVFEYCCQIDDSDDVLIGSNILDTYQEDFAYLYTYAFVNKNSRNDNNYSLTAYSTPTISSGVASINNAVKMTINDGKLGIKLYSSMSWNYENKEETSLGTQQSFQTNKDLVIFRQKILEGVAQGGYDTYGELITLNTSFLPPLSQQNIGKYAVNGGNIKKCTTDYGGQLVSNQNVYLANLETDYPANDNTGHYALVNTQSSVGTLISNLPYSNVNLIPTGSGSTYKYALCNSAGNDAIGTLVSTTIYSGDTSAIPYDANDYRNYYAMTTQNGLCKSVRIIGAVFGWEPQSSITSQVTLLWSGQAYLYNPSNNSISVKPDDWNIYYCDRMGGTTFWVEAPSYNSSTFKYDDGHTYVVSGSGFAMNDNNELYFVDRIGSSRFWTTAYSGDYSKTFRYTSNGVDTYYKIVNNQLQTATVNLIWDDYGSASDKYFTYNNTIYQYIASRNYFIQVRALQSRSDLMFIVKNMENANITDNELKLSINYYDTD